MEILPLVNALPFPLRLRRRDCLAFTARGQSANEKRGNRVFFDLSSRACTARHGAIRII